MAVEEELEPKLKQRSFFSAPQRRCYQGDLTIAREIEEEILKTNIGSICDVGCGEGQFTNSIFRMRKDVSVVGVDLSRYALLKAKLLGNTEGPDFLACDVENLPFRSHSFDCAIMVNLLHHLPSINAVFEIRRVIRIGGLFFIHDHAYLNNPVFFIFYKLAFLFPMFRQDIGQGKLPPVFMYSFGSLVRVLKSVGFELLCTRRDTLIFRPLIAVITVFLTKRGHPKILSGSAAQALCELDDVLKNFSNQFCYDFSIVCHLKG